MSIIKEMPSLYKKASTGKIQKNTIKVESILKDGADINDPNPFNDNYNIVIKTYRGYVDGKLTIDKGKIIKSGKNIGKANETTVEEQAISQALSMWKKKKKVGYFISAYEAEHRLVILPMLAKKESDIRKTAKKIGKSTSPKKPVKEKITFPVVVQPKLDGIRCTVKNSFTRIPDNNGQRKIKARMQSRENTVFELFDHIKREVEDFAPRNRVLDGELYSHELTFQEITSIVAREKNMTADKIADQLKIKLMVYDSFWIDYLGKCPKGKIDKFEVSAEVFMTRYNEAKKIVDQCEYLEIVPNYIAQNWEEVDEIHKKLILEGYEGSIIRNMEGIYEIDKRSENLLKKKDFEDDEFEIIGYKEADGNDIGTVVWRCITKQGYEFDCKPKGARNYRKDLFERAASFIGEMLTIRYFETGDDNGIPRFPVGVSIRKIK